MKSIKVMVGLLLSMALVGGMVSLAWAGAQPPTAVKEYEGQVRSIRIDKCGLQPGSCEGSLVLAQKGGQDIVLAIKSGTWIQRGSDLVLIDELGVGNYVKARAIRRPGVTDELAITLEQTGRE